MKTTREIIEACDTSDVKMHVMRDPREKWEYVSKAYSGAWAVHLSAERDGVKIEIAFQRADTFDAALAKAWAKFEPASTAGLPPVPALAAPNHDGGIDDADYAEIL